MTTPVLELHDRVPERVLAVVAHPDDLEYGAAALVCGSPLATHAGGHAEGVAAVALGLTLLQREAAPRPAPPGPCALSSEPGGPHPGVAPDLLLTGFSSVHITTAPADEEQP